MKVHVTLDWLIDVRGTDDPEEAKGIAYNYVADQEIEESAVYVAHEDDVVCDPQTSPFDDVDDYDAETTITLYPEGEPVVPANERGAWSTYTPSPSYLDEVEAMREADRG